MKGQLSMNKKTLLFKGIALLALISILLTGCGAGKTNTVDSESESHSEFSQNTSEFENSENPVNSEGSIDTEDTQSTEIPEDTKLPDDTQIPVDTQTPQDSQAPEDTQTPEDTQSPDDTQLPDDSKDPVVDTTPEKPQPPVTNPEDHKNYEDTVINSTLGSISSKEQSLAREIINKIITKDMSDFDKVKAINDYMILNVRYDRENYAKDTIPYSCYTALGAMEDGVAVCAGYAKMFVYLAQAADLEATYVVGYARGSHAWNQVKVDGKWYNIDVTWNDPDCEYNEKGHYYCGCYQYFLISNELMEKSHTPRSKVHECNDNLDLPAICEGCPYSEERVYNETQADITKHIKEMVSRNQFEDHFVVATYNTLKDSVTNALKECKIYPDSYKLTISREYTIYRESGNLIYASITIEPKNGTIEDLAITPVSTYQQVQQTFEKIFAGESKYTYDRNNPFVLYVTDALFNDKHFMTQLNEWAYYEHNVYLENCSNWCKVDENVNSIKLTINKTENQTLYLSAYSIDELEPIVRRMVEHNNKEVVIMLYENNHLLVGDDANARFYHFKRTYCQDLIETYCLEINASGQYEVNGDCITLRIKDVDHDIEHVYWQEHTAATCATEGLNVKYCMNCGQIAATQVIETNNNHTYYWDVAGDTRTQKCKACPYVGITEIRMGDVWGYYNEAKAVEYVERINRQRENIWIGVSDEWGNAIGVISPPQLSIDAALTEKAKVRVIQLILSDFETTIDDEAYYRNKYYPNNNYVRGYTSGVDLYDEHYSRVGVSCFCVDYDDSGFNFLDQYAFEFAE